MESSCTFSPPETCFCVNGFESNAISYSEEAESSFGILSNTNVEPLAPIPNLIWSDKYGVSKGNKYIRDEDKSAIYGNDYCEKNKKDNSCT